MTSRVQSTNPLVPVPAPRPAAPQEAAAAGASSAFSLDLLSLGGAAPPTTVTVEEGDNLSTIAKRVLGDEKRWTEIFEANRDQLRDPNRINVGMTLRLPGAEPVPAPTPAPRPAPCKFDDCDANGPEVIEAVDRVRRLANNEEVTYTVKRGDSLSRIANRLLGDGSRWPEILEANSDQLTRPEALQPGMTLKIPSGAREVLRPRATDLGEEGPVQSGDFWDMAREIGRKHNVDPRLIMAVVMKESSGNPRARSGAGARGLMQLMPGTARDLGVRDSYNPRQNMEGGTRYLKQMLNQFGDLRLALMAYNWGPGNVNQYLRGRKQPPSETRNYVPGVLAFYRQFGGRA